MAQPTNTYDTYDLVGGREDLLDIITNISPTDVPFQSNIGRTKANFKNTNEFDTSDKRKCTWRFLVDEPD